MVLTTGFHMHTQTCQHVGHRTYSLIQAGLKTHSDVPASVLQLLRLQVRGTPLSRVRIHELYL